MVICEICKQEYRVIKTAHLTNHGITREEYKLKYPNSMLFSEETKRLNSEISKKLWMKVEILKKIHFFLFQSY